MHMLSDTPLTSWLAESISTAYGRRHRQGKPFRALVRTGDRR